MYESVNCQLSIHAFEINKKAVKIDTYKYLLNSLENYLTGKFKVSGRFASGFIIG